MTAENLKIIVSEPTYPEAEEISKEDVFGKWSDDHVKIHSGMVVARTDEQCPIFGNKVPFKSVTVVFAKELAEQVAYWCEYVHGADCIQQVKELPDGQMAFRSDYMCW